jgi:site-specific DNA recombinase
LDELVWTDLCALLTEPEQLAQGLARAHAGNWLPQELQARREGLRKGQTSLEQQLERLTKAYLDGIVGLEEFGRRRSEGEQRRQALLRQQAQLEAQVNRQAEVAHLALSLEDFCHRIRAGLAQASLEQKRHLMELLVDRVVVTEGEVEIRYVMPTTPESERVRFCQLRSDHRRISQSFENGVCHGAAAIAAGRDCWPYSVCWPLWQCGCCNCAPSPERPRLHGRAKWWSRTYWKRWSGFKAGPSTP